jgi:hypothetical protein
MHVELDRMAIEDVGANPERLAQAIHDQLPGLQGAVPVYDIARALDIEEIRDEALSGFEGALITPPEKGTGSILVNATSPRQRRRYTVGHELGHFLNPWLSFATLKHCPQQQGKSLGPFLRKPYSRHFCPSASAFCATRKSARLRRPRATGEAAACKLIWQRR